MGDHTHKVQVPRDPEQTMLSRDCQRCGDRVMVSMLSPQTDGGNEIDVEAVDGSYWDREVTVELDGSVASILCLVAAADIGVNNLPENIGVHGVGIIGKHFVEEAKTAFDRGRLEEDAQGLVARHADSLDDMLAVDVEVQDREDEQ